MVHQFHCGFEAGFPAASTACGNPERVADGVAALRPVMEIATRGTAWAVADEGTGQGMRRRVRRASQQAKAPARV